MAMEHARAGAQVDAHVVGHVDVGLTISGEMAERRRDMHVGRTAAIFRRRVQVDGARHSATLERPPQQTVDLGAGGIGLDGVSERKDGWRRVL